MNLLDTFEVRLPRDEAAPASLFVLTLQEEICQLLDIPFVDFSNDFELLKRVQQENADPNLGDWPAFNPAFDPACQVDSLSPGKAFFLSVSIGGKVKAAKAIKLRALNLGETLQKALVSKSYIYDRPEMFPNDIVTCDCDSAYQIRGCYVCDSGALWVHPDLRGKGLNIGGKLTLLSHAVAFSTMPVDWFVAMINPENTIRILHRDQGFTKVEFPFKWKCEALPGVEQYLKALEFKARHELRNYMALYGISKEGKSVVH